ncbi:MAG: right-handed parallel beta-helix repeat-containing protein, partial [Myxococcota bacterium]
LSGAQLGGAIAASGGAIRLKTLTFEGTAGGAAIRLADTIATLEDVTIQGGAAAGADAAGGIDSRSTDLTIVGLEIEEISGTGMIVIGGSLAMEDAEVRDCDGTFAGGLIASQLTDLALTHVRLANNRAGSLVGGAEIRLTQSVVLDSVVIEGNTAAFEVGGMYVSDVGDVAIRDSRIAENDGGFTGGFEIWNADTVVVDRVEIRANGTLTPSIQGGFAFANVPDLTVRDTRVEGQRASLLPAGGTALNVTGLFEDVVFRDNVSDGDVGGIGTGLSSVVLRRPVLEDNSGLLAGGAYCGSGDLTIESPQFTGNTPVPWGEGPDCLLTDAAEFATP